MPAVGWKEERKKDYPDSLKIEGVRTVEGHSSYGWVIAALMLAGLVILGVPHLFVVTF